MKDIDIFNQEWQTDKVMTNKQRQKLYLLLQAAGFVIYEGTLLGSDWEVYPYIKHRASWQRSSLDYSIVGTSNISSKVYPYDELIKDLIEMIENT